MTYYLGRTPNPAEQYRLEVMEKVATAIAGEQLIEAGIQMGSTVPPTPPQDTLSSFLIRIGKGKLDSAESLYKFGLIVLKAIR